MPSRKNALEGILGPIVWANGEAEWLLEGTSLTLKVRKSMRLIPVEGFSEVAKEFSLKARCPLKMSLRNAFFGDLRALQGRRRSPPPVPDEENESAPALGPYRGKRRRSSGKL